MSGVMGDKGSSRARTYRKRLIGLGLGVTAAYFALTHLPSSEEYCPTPAEYVQVEMQGHVFELPWKANLWNGEQDLIRICNADAPVPVTRITLSPYDDEKRGRGFYDKYNNDAIFEKTRRGFSLLISIYTNNLSMNGHEENASSYQDSYVRDVVPILEKEGKSLSDFPQKNGFYLISTEDGSARYYVAIDKSLSSDQSHPVTISCLRFGSDGDYFCESRIVWNNNITIAFEHLQQLYVPEAQYRGFLKDFIAYIQSLEIIKRD